MTFDIVFDSVPLDSGINGDSLMRFLLIVSLTLIGAGPISTNGRVITLLQKVLPGEKVTGFVVGAGFIGLTLCATITGCERGERILSGVVDIEGDETDDYSSPFGPRPILGRYIPPVESPQIDQLQTDLWPIPDNDAPIPNHEDIGAEVNQLNIIGDGKAIQRWGEVVDVYESGYYRIEITREAYTNFSRHGTFYPFDMLIHQDLPWGEGGFDIMYRKR